MGNSPSSEEVAAAAAAAPAPAADDDDNKPEASEVSASGGGGGAKEDEDEALKNEPMRSMGIETSAEAEENKKQQSSSSILNWVLQEQDESNNSTRGGILFRRRRRQHRPLLLPPKYRLVTEDDPLKNSMMSLYFGVAVAAINTKMLNPNYPIMVSPGLHPDSFESTEPFAFNSATYFLPMCSLLGVAISSVFLGQISDKVGRKRVFSILSWVSGVGSIVKYFARETFWGFCIASFVFGLFLGNLPVGMAYVGDVFTSKKEKQEKLGYLVSCFVMGNSGGGMIAILMKSSGLFAPLWVGAGLSFVSAMITGCFMIEPGDARLKPIGKDLLLEQVQEQDEEEDEARPETINQCTMWNIVGGALADNIGSTALFPMCLSPLALEQYTIDFVSQGLDPIMSVTGYQWLSVCVAIMVVPATMITPYVFRRRGVAGTCVLGNIWTAVLTLALLLIGNGPATTGAFAGFVIVLYGGYPVTVWSQLTTGPMLDVIAPEDKIGFVQGLNNSAMNFGMALAPWLFGLLADATSTNTSIITGICVSVLAATINAPLMWRPELGKVEEKPPKSKRRLPGEDEEMVEKYLNGEFIPPADLFVINRTRALEGQPMIIPKVKPYEEDKETLGELYDHAWESFEFRMMLHDRALAEIGNPNREKDLEEICDLLNATKRGPDEAIKESLGALGHWVSDYLVENGYEPQVSTMLIKSMVLSAFPPVREGPEYTPENLEDALLRSRQVLNQYLDIHKKKKRYSATSTLAGFGAQRIYS